MTSDPAVHVFRPHREAPVLWVLGERLRILIRGEETDGRLALIEVYSPPFSPGPPPHIHEDADEMFHVIEGAIKVSLGEQSVTARPGDTLIVPRGSLHTYSNPFLTPCRFLAQLSPAGFERFFMEIGVPPASATDLLTPPVAAPPSAEKIAMLARKHRMRIPGLTD